MGALYSSLRSVCIGDRSSVRWLAAASSSWVSDGDVDGARGTTIESRGEEERARGGARGQDCLT